MGPPAADTLLLVTKPPASCLIIGNLPVHAAYGWKYKLCFAELSADADTKKLPVRTAKRGRCWR